MGMPELPKGFEDHQWVVSLCGSYVTTQLVNPKGYSVADEKQIYRYSSRPVLLLIEEQAQAILDRISLANRLKHELGVEVNWS